MQIVYLLTEETPQGAKRVLCVYDSRTVAEIDRRMWEKKVDGISLSVDAWYVRYKAYRTGDELD